MGRLVRASDPGDFLNQGGNKTPMNSPRFNRPIRLTDHAKRRMAERGIDEALILNIIETGWVKYKDERHLWIFKDYPDRTDNLLCVAALLADALIVKTVMHHFTPEE
jgi:hypothetical protein